MSVIAEGPFHTLIGWRGGGARWLAFNLFIHRRSPDEDSGNPNDRNKPFDVHSIACSPDESVPSGFGVHRSLERFRYRWNDAGEPVADPAIWINGQWQFLFGVDSHDGLPELPIVHEFDFGEWFASPRNPANEPARSRPQAEWESLAGAEYQSGDSDGLSVPDHPELRFKVASSVTLRMMSTTPAWGDVCNAGVRWLLAPLDDPDAIPWETPFAPLVIDLTAIRVTTNNRVWRPVAAALELDEDFESDGSGNPTTAGRMWVLCERDEAASA